MEDIVTDSEPPVLLVPVHAPEAEHDVALDDAHEMSTVPPTSPETMLDVKEVITAASFATTADPPPPPPPHEDRIKTEATINECLKFKRILIPVINILNMYSYE